jgi:ribosomal protein S18 acetylase RimI-like enzyme
MKIRHADPLEFNRIADIHIESWKNSYSNILPSDFLDGQIDQHLYNHWSNVEIKNEDVLLVAEEEEIIGFIAVWCRPAPFIDNLHIKPSYRSRNVGTALMKAAAEDLISKGQPSGYLWVFNSNENAIRFYTKLGGISKEREIKDIFGHGVEHRKIVWDDLSIIITRVLVPV